MTSLSLPLLVVQLCVVTLVQLQFPGVSSFDCSDRLVADNCLCSSANKTVECINSTAATPSLLVFLTNGSLGIRSLNIRDSQIARVDKNLLGKSNVLYGLHLDNDGIQLILEESFQNLLSLETLSLENNRIRVLLPGTFDGLSKLKTLSLSGNPLYAIDRDVFTVSALPLLNSLDLRHCRLNDFQPNSFSNLRQLTTLNMSGNRLDTFPLFGDHLDSLTSIDLSSNKIRSLEGTNLLPSKLTILYLSDNLIEKLTNTSIFSNGSQLRLNELILAGNRLSVMETGSLIGVNCCLQVLDLSRNNLTIVDTERWPWKTLQKVIIHDNSWYCPNMRDGVDACVNDWLVVDSVAKWNSWANVTCFSPASLIGKNIYSDKVFDTCTDILARRRPIALLVCTVLMFCLAASVVIGVLVVRRRRRAHRVINTRQSSSSPRRRRRGRTDENNDTEDWSDTRVSYKQMVDYSRAADHNEI